MGLLHATEGTLPPAQPKSMHLPDPQMPSDSLVSPDPSDVGRPAPATVVHLDEGQGSPSSPPSTSGHWPKVRALLIALVILANVIVALPIRHAISRAQLRSLEGQAEVLRWHQLLSSAGSQLSRAELENLAVRWSRTLSGLHKSLSAPFQPLFSLTGIGQRWALFSYPDTHPNRLVIEARSGVGAWETFYRALDPAHAWNVERLHYRRVRAVYNQNQDKPPPAYENFGTWVAQQIFDARPDLDQVHVLLERSHTTLPHEAPDVSRERRHVRNYRRDGHGVRREEP